MEPQKQRDQYSNLERIADESGREMDFVSGMRTLEGLVAETRLA